jgi:hypothetical protein
MLDTGAGKIHSQPDPSNAGTKHLEGVKNFSWLWSKGYALEEPWGIARWHLAHLA